MCRKLCLALSISLVLTAGCAGKKVLTDPAFQPQIINQTDSFSLQSTNVSGVSQTLQYTWQNTGTNANVNQATQLTAGSAILTILDSANQQVYTNSMTANGTFTTSRGASGNWTIRLVVTNCSGTLNFRVQKP
jgi:hypothetical protein